MLGKLPQSIGKCTEAVKLPKQVDHMKLILNNTNLFLYNLSWTPDFEKKGRQMRKALIVILVLAVGAGGYLGWDWYAKTKKQTREPSITLYYWTDAQGNKYFSDSPPPADARDIHTEKGYRYIKPPLVVLIKNKAIDFYQTARDKLFKSKKKEKK